MSIEKRFFGKLDGKGNVDIYKITNKNGAFVELMTLGAGIHSINVPDRNGKLGDVVLGFDDVNNYLNPDLGYQGLVVGRYANRIRDAKFSMDGVEYNTPKNQGTWTLHVVSVLIFGRLRKQATILLYFLSSHPICRTDFPAISQ